MLRLVRENATVTRPSPNLFARYYYAEFVTSVKAFSGFIFFLRPRWKHDLPRKCIVACAIVMNAAVISTVDARKFAMF